MLGLIQPAHFIIDLPHAANGQVFQDGAFRSQFQVFLKIAERLIILFQLEIYVAENVVEPR